MKVLLDTNVILDFFLVREPRYENVKKIFELVYQEKIEAYTTSNSITDIYYIVAKRLGNGAARGVLSNLFNLLAIIAVNGDDCIFALDIPITDYEDALIATCAQRDDMDYVITHDVEFLAVASSIVYVIAPSDFLKMIS
ncbi:MAG: PIN domain-containing protein [Peptococcaceae bacterium]|jgi:predicted nucleic acid-binding protein|nr:PIN domain-containing protein [Peptococcaceae bacterium]